MTTFALIGLLIGVTLVVEGFLIARRFDPK